MRYNIYEIRNYVKQPFLGGESAAAAGVQTGLGAAS